MATAEDIDSAIDTQVDNAPAAGATPQFSLGDVQNMFRGLINEVKDAINQPAPRRAAPSEPEPEGLTDDEYESLSPQQRSAVDKAIKRSNHKLRQEVNQLREFGLNRIADLTQSVVAAKLPYYNEYKAEIDGELARLDPALRTDPTSIQLVHDAVAMRHDTERVQRARDEALRQARGDAPALPQGGTGGSRAMTRQTPRDANKVMTPEELGFNDDQLNEIDAKGGPDAFARTISQGRYADWAAYSTAYSKMRAGRTPRGNVVPLSKKYFAAGKGGQVLGAN